MLDSEDVQELIHLTSKSLVNVGLGLFPEAMSIKPSKLHYKLSDALVNDDRSTAFALPRGFGKSTYAWDFLSSWNILHRRYRYIMFIGSTATIAEEMFLNAKACVLNHPILKSCVKVIRETKSLLMYTIDGKGYRMAAYGAGQQLRGKRYESHRPDLIVLDDLETTEAVRSQDQRKFMKDWFFADVLQLDKNARFFYIGTYLHEDCLLANLINEPLTDAKGISWNTFRYGVLTYDTGVPTWEEKYDATWVEMERKKYISQGMLHRFNTELMNVAVDRQDRAFDPKNVRFYNAQQLEAVQKGGFDVVMIVDPGIRQKSDNDPTVVLTCGMDSVGNMWMINVERHRLRYNEILHLIVSQYREYNPRALYVEAVQGQDYLVQSLEYGTWEGGITLPVDRIDNKLYKMGKNVRIQTLDDIFVRRKLYAPASCEWWVDFCDEMITFPRGKHDDILDSLAYAKYCLVEPDVYSVDVDAIINTQSSTVF